MTTVDPVSAASAASFPAPPGRFVTAWFPLPQSPCDYRSKRTGECVEGVDDNPVGATAECGDGLYSHSVTRSGTCSHHDGVAEWCPCDSSHSTLAGAAAPPPDADTYFLGLVSEIPGMIIRDPALMTATARELCVHLRNGDESRDLAITTTMQNTVNGTLGAATAMVDAAISAYCPDFGG
ncbi:DUF3761 domain-containing protein [Mycobacterium intracellulare]|nr:DUF3761 domain-containing protein [Mycobacterium intracellulare]UEB27471.1 DUF3761 domain-containing protein [Mycobacterium intracellulare]